MSRVRMALATALVLLCGNALLAGEPMGAKLVVPDSRILPGVPFDFWVELHNRSEDARRVSICGPFQMRLISGEPFQWTETPHQMRLRSENYGGSETFVWPRKTTPLAMTADRGMISGDFFRDRRFSAPGRRFAIALPLCELVDTGEHPPTVSKWMTTEAEIEIVTPVASDATVWNLIEEWSGRQWTPSDMSLREARALWESVLRDFPDSNYIPYAVLMTGPYKLHNWRDHLARTLRTIKRFPDSPVVEWLHVEAWRTARALRLHGVMLAEGAIVRKSNRPTTRLLASR